MSAPAAKDAPGVAFFGTLDLLPPHVGERQADAEDAVFGVLAVRDAGAALQLHAVVAAAQLAGEVHGGAQRQRAEHFQSDAAFAEIDELGAQRAARVVETQVIGAILSCCG